jgi:predicted DNA-binding transcriptional regulator AlpA
MTRPTTATTTASDELLTVKEVIAELRIPRSTWYQWRQTRKAPTAFKLPNGEVRIRRSVLNHWLEGLESDAA